MTLKQALKKLEGLADEKVRSLAYRKEVGDKQYGVKSGDLRKLAKEIKSNHELALELWETENVDARLLAILLMKPKSLSSEELDGLVSSCGFVPVADWLNAYIVKKHPDKESLREEWMKADHPMRARSAWALTAERVAKSPEGLDIAALLDRIEAEMGAADPVPQWTMNIALTEIGINLPKHRKRAIAIGEKLGVYSDYPVTKGCISPFAPIWINEMVKRQG